MTDLVPLFPNQTVPPLRGDLAGGGQFDLASEKPTNFTLVVFYRGLHCPICKTQLKDLESKLDDFEERGVAVVAVSTDSKERREQTREKLETVAAAHRLRPLARRSPALGTVRVVGAWQDVGRRR